MWNILLLLWKIEATDKNNSKFSTFEFERKIWKEAEEEGKDEEDYI